MNTVAQIVLFTGVGLLAVSVMVCGLGLALGFYRISMFGFFGALVLMGLLRLAVAGLRRGNSQDTASSRQNGRGPADNGAEF